MCCLLFLKKRVFMVLSNRTYQEQKQLVLEVVLSYMQERRTSFNIILFKNRSI